jgi:hypothetical protein
VALRITRQPFHAAAAPITSSTTESSSSRRKGERISGAFCWQTRSSFSAPPEEPQLFEVILAMSENQW